MGEMAIVLYGGKTIILSMAVRALQTREVFQRRRIKVLLMA